MEGGGLKLNVVTGWAPPRGDGHGDDAHGVVVVCDSDSKAASPGPGCHPLDFELLHHSLASFVSCHVR